MAEHVSSYKLLFSHARMVEDLLRGFVKEAWGEQLDFSTLERMSGRYVSDDLRDRENVISPKANPYQQEKHNGGVPWQIQDNTKSKS